MTPPPIPPPGPGPATTRPSRRDRTSRTVLVFSVLVVLACVAWAALVQVTVPDACRLPAPPPRAQYLHCAP